MEVLEVLSPGLLTTVQDGGRPGWRRFGIPPGGAMDRTAWQLANRLLNNPEQAPVLECLQGVRLRALTPLHLAAAGAWGGRAWPVKAGEVIEFPPTLAGVWHTLALPGGIEADRFLGSASTCPRAGIGHPLAKGEHVSCLGLPDHALPHGIKGRQPSRAATPSYAPAPIRVWPGPQWEMFDADTRARFLASAWQVSSRSDRTGYRLDGPLLRVPTESLVSEPVRIGSVQIPPGGQPVVTLNDGPTVGGYAKIALVEPDDLDRLVQTRPGLSVQFQLVA